MTKFIALLRGINVSSQKKFKMSDLKSLFEEAGFENVETYIQSGNVIFSAKEKSKSKLENKISSAIESKFGFEVQVIVVTPTEIEYILKHNPFIKEKKEADKLYVTFLSRASSNENIKKLNAIDYSPEEYTVDGKCIYLFVPNGYGKAKLNNNFFEKKLNVSGSTRNLKTLNAILELTKLH